MKNPLKILIIDDEESFALVLSLDLKSSEHFDTTVANSGEAGIEILKKEKMDVVLLDYHLGTMNGLQVMQWMNENKIDTPVVLLTGAGTEEIAVEAMKLGAYDYSRKERLELNHLPILLNGVYERYQFRKEKERKELERIEEDKQHAALQMFQTTVRTIAHHVNNALAIIMLRSSVTEKNIKKTLDTKAAEPYLQLVADLRKQAAVIESVVRSLVELSNVVYTKYASDQSIIDILSQLEANLKEMEEQKDTEV